jgi:hypothetical protein
MCRLEAATSRLEDMAMGLDEHNAQKAPDSTAALEPEPSKQPTPTAPAAPAPIPLPPQIEDFDTLIDKDVNSFVDLGRKIGGLVEEQVGRHWSPGNWLNVLLIRPIVQRRSTSVQGRAHLPLRFYKGEETRHAASRAYGRAPHCFRYY